MARNNRKREYIDPAVQGALMRRMVLHWLAFTVVAGGLAVLLQWMQDPFASVAATFQQAWWSYGAVLLLLICLMPVFVYDAVKLSNRFAGPVQRLRVALRDLADGKGSTTLTFRDDDFWKELASDFNRVAERLERQERNDTADSPDAVGV
ncbi:hypothetical protein Pla175_15320 [Pirellulimonas nuda]|uniref:HAMP domain-containing protein n=1 Tax=Pirellulimonas nuda TaxID=2528009 RepID=A0A518D9K5_9BACT|nr:hypothetical protein [Pirellulimonas nuda]QDU88161.1 hypothetical protein Pla175_15320 [Pirellulimonas nuda]